MGSKVKEIVDGWQNLMYRDPIVEVEATKRALICSNCPELSEGAGVYLHCKKCGCYLPAKVRSIVETNKCPLNKW